MVKEYFGKTIKTNVGFYILIFFIVIIIFKTNFVFADSWNNEPSHPTAFVNTITSRDVAAGQPVKIADNEGLIITTGNVGIGTLTPTQKLDVLGQIHSSGDICTDAAGGKCLSTVGGGSSGWTEDVAGNKVYVTTIGRNVGIGTTTPSYKLDVLGEARLQPTSQPATLLNGVIYYDSTANKFKCYENGVLKDCITSGSSLPSGTSGQTLRHDGTNWVANSLLNNDGSRVEILNNGETFLNIRNTEAGGRQYALISSGVAGGLGGAGKFSIYDNSLGISRLIIDTNGNVGIGTTTPGAKLDVVGDIQWSGTLQSGTVPWARISGFPGDTTPDTIADDGIISDSEASDILTIDNGLLFAPITGNVGIGTTTPGTKLDVVGGAIRGDNGLTIISGAVSLPSGQIDNTELANPSLSITAGSGLSGGGLVSLGGSTSLSLNTGNANTWSAAQTFSANTNFPGSGIWNTLGSVGIGTLTPTQKLDVLGQIHSSGDICTDAAGGKCLSTAGGGSSGWTEDVAGNKVYVTTIGRNVGIGTTTPATKLDVVGDIQWSGTLQSGTVPWAKISGFPGDTTPDTIADDGSITLGTETTGTYDSTSDTIADDGVISDSEASDVLTINNGLLFAPITGNVGVGTTSPGGKIEIASSSRNALRLKKTAGVAGSVQLFPAVGDATSRTGSALCQTVSGAAICLGQWTSAGTVSACATSITFGRALCGDFGD